MLRSFTAVTCLSGALLVGAWLGATSYAPRAQASELPGVAGAAAHRASEMQQPIDPKKKMPGDACKSSDECQKHHTCAKVDGKDVCKAPPARRLPPGAVT